MNNGIFFMLLHFLMLARVSGSEEKKDWKKEKNQKKNVERVLLKWNRELKLCLN